MNNRVQSKSATMAEKKRKKIDYEALQSSFMQIPMMKADIARGLLDLGVREYYELSGRAPEVLADAMTDRDPALRTIPDLLERLQLAVYFVETPDHDPRKLKLSYWTQQQ